MTMVKAQNTTSNLAAIERPMTYGRQVKYNGFSHMITEISANKSLVCLGRLSIPDHHNQFWNVLHIASTRAPL